MIDPQKPPILYDWIHEDDLMQILRCTKRTLENWREKGIIPFSKLGKFVYYQRQDIEAALINNYKNIEPCKRKRTTTGATHKTTKKE